MPSIRLSTGAVHSTDQGSGPPMVLVHANPGDRLDFEAVIPELSKNYRVLAVDWPGYGASDPPPLPAGVLVFYNVLREFLDSLALPAFP